MLSASNDSLFKPIHNACFTGNVELVEVLANFGADLNTPASNGMTPLICAVKNGHAKLSGWLIEHGVDVEPKTTKAYKAMPAGVSAAEACGVLTDQTKGKVRKILREHGLSPS